MQSKSYQRLFYIYEVLLQRSTYMWICAVSIKFHQLEYLVFEYKILEVFWKGKISTFELFWNKRFQVFALFWNKMQTPQIFLPRSLCKQRGPRDLGRFVNLWKYILGNFLNCFFVTWKRENIFWEEWKGKFFCLLFSATGSQLYTKDRLSLHQ